MWTPQGRSETHDWTLYWLMPRWRVNSPPGPARQAPPPFPSSRWRFQWRGTVPDSYRARKQLLPGLHGETQHKKRNRKRVLLSGRRIWITTKRKRGAVERNEWRLKWFGLGGGEWVIRGWRNFNMEGNVTFISSALTHSVSSVWIFHVRLFQSY